MAKYPHTGEVKTVLDDLENRVIQLIEANERYKSQNPNLVYEQNTALSSVLVLIRQVRNTGHVKRGTPVIPDDLEPVVKTKWDNRPQLGLSELMQEVREHA